MDADNSNQFTNPPGNSTQVQAQQASATKQKIPISVIIGVSVFLILIGVGVYSSMKQKVPISHIPQNSQISSLPTNTSPTSRVKTTSDPTINWKPISIDAISFKYPADFQSPEFVKTQFGQSAEIKKIDNTQRIIVMSGINKGHTEKELTEYIDTFVEGGGQRLFLDNNEAVLYKDNSLGQKITTVTMNAKDNKSQYSISIQSSESFSDKEIDTLLNQILFTLKFE